MTDESTSNSRRTAWAVTASLVVVVMMGLLLRAEGRMFFGTDGQFRFWVSDTCSSNNSQQFFDPYSFTHILHGFLFFWILAVIAKRVAPIWQLWLALTLEAAWEVLENSAFIINRYRTETAALGYFGDTIVNSFGDLVCAIAGFLIARQLGFWRSLIFFILLELVLILWIRDSLLLEILMLIHPVNAIKLWQMCR